MVSYLMQWAAVRTQLLATRVPPQVWDHFPKDWYCRETWGGGEHGHMGGRALEEGKAGRALPSDPCSSPNLELLILLPSPPGCWGYRCVSANLVTVEAF